METKLSIAARALREGAKQVDLTDAFHKSASRELTKKLIHENDGDKLNETSATMNDKQHETKLSDADEKLSQRLDGQREVETPQIHADDEVNDGPQVEYGLMLCSDRCIKSRVHSGRCFHS